MIDTPGSGVSWDAPQQPLHPALPVRAGQGGRGRRDQTRTEKSNSIDYAA